MMPTNQRCPGCGAWFMGSDAIGDVCDKCKAIEEGHTVELCSLCQGRGWTIKPKKPETLERPESLRATQTSLTFGKLRKTGHLMR